MNGLATKGAFHTPYGALLKAYRSGTTAPGNNMYLKRLGSGRYRQRPLSMGKAGARAPRGQKTFGDKKGRRALA